MKPYIKIYIAALLVLFSVAASAQHYKYCGEFDIKPREVIKDGRLVNVGFDIVPGDDFKFQRQQSVRFTPILVSNDGQHVRKLAPVIILGRMRAKATHRSLELNNFRWDTEPYSVVRYLGKHNPPIPVTFKVDYEPWMRDAQLIVREEATGCANCRIEQYSHELIARIMPAAYVPHYELAYITPEIEEIKVRAESYEARLTFQNGKSQLLPTYMNNARELSEIDMVIRKVTDDPNLTITDFKVTGYASPDGNTAQNLKLSQDRAEALVSYIIGKHDLSRRIFDVRWKGEDWDGLRVAMQKSFYEHANEVISIIDHEYDADRRKSRIRAMNGGRTYRYLLDNIYPSLRRNEYTLSYVAKPFDAEEAAALIRTAPQNLSLYEMFMAANLYEKGSQEFKEVFDIAVRMFPNDPVANINSAALDLERGAVSQGLERSLRYTQHPEALNNIGMAYLQQKNYDGALEYFKRAADAGLVTGINNLTNLKLWLEDME